MVMSLWGTYYQRYSERQRGGGFGTLPTGAAANTNTIENQQFYTFGFETRLRLTTNGSAERTLWLVASKCIAPNRRAPTAVVPLPSQAQARSVITPTAR